jgi:hypothetical protein
VLIVGHPFVDIWQAVRPRLVGLEAWPAVPRTIEWKAGICAAVGPRLGANEPAEFWRLLLGRVQGWLDLEPALLGPVEQLIDFVTEPAGCGAG